VLVSVVVITTTPKKKVEPEAAGKDAESTRPLGGAEIERV